MLDECSKTRHLRVLKDGYAALGDALRSDVAVFAKPELRVTLTYPFESAANVKATRVGGKWRLVDLCLAIGEAYRLAYKLEGHKVGEPTKDLARLGISVEGPKQPLRAWGHVLGDLHLEGVVVNQMTGMCVPEMGS